jgi:putative transposase
LLDRIGDFAAFLAAAEDTPAITTLRGAYSTGRPAGAEDWMRQLEQATARPLAPRKRGPKAKAGLPAEADLFSKLSP